MKPIDILGRWNGIVRSAAHIGRTKPVKAKRSKPRRTSTMRDRKYLDFLTHRKCLAATARCWRQCSDPAHGPSAAMRVKGPDSGAIPLCREHHIEQHSIGWPAFEAKYGIDREKEAAAHYALYLLEREAA